MQIEININKLYPETIFYLNWARKSKNIKTKRKLVKKALKEMNSISGKDIRRRIKRKGIVS